MSGVTKVEFTVEAVDGSLETRYLEIIKLSDDITIMEVTVDRVVIMPNEAGDYEATVTDELDLSEIGVKLNTATSKVMINGKNEALGETTCNISKGTNRKIIIQIKVTAEDGMTHTYTLTLNIISSNARVQKVLADNELCKLEDGVYKAYIDKFAKEATIDITPKVEYSIVSHENEDGSEVSDIGKLQFKLKTEDLSVDIFTTKFKVIAEDRN
ncbi:MAG: cadherin-like beta sandwich domain-containing protein [Clostridia bacterium]|nr:cadherin-like beta sandwich domain-containing protein [Clostridia bacterium]